MQNMQLHDSEGISMDEHMFAANICLHILCTQLRGVKIGSIMAKKTRLIQKKTLSYAAMIGKRRFKSHPELEKIF